MNIKGLDNFFDVLALVNDPSKYESKVAELRKTIDEYKVVIESVVKLSEVNDYTVNIKKSKEEAILELAKAKEEAQKIKEAAKVSAEAKKASLSELEAKLMARNGDLNTKQAVVDSREKDAAVKEKELAAKEKQLAEKQEALNTLALELEEKKAKLLAAMS